jgi:hypothetical protein
MSIIINHYKYNYSKKMRRQSKRKNVKTQKGGMKSIKLHEMYNNERINALFRDDAEGRVVSDFFRKTGKIIQMPDGLEAKLYNGQLCFNSKRVTQYPQWMEVTFQLNGIIPPPPTTTTATTTRTNRGLVNIYKTS